MNGEEEGAMEVMQEPHPSLLIEEQPTPVANPGTEQFEASEAANTALLEAEKDEGGDSSLIAERSGDVIVGAEVPVGESSVAGEEGGKLRREGEDLVVVEVEHGAVDESVKVKEASLVGEAAREGKDQVVEDEKLDGCVETQTDMEQFDVLNVADEIAKDDETEGVDGSDVNGNDLQDCEMMEEGNAQDLETESKVVNESEVELKGETEVEEKKENKIEERQAEEERTVEVEEAKAMETERMDGGEESMVVIVGTESSVVKDEQIQDNEGEGEIEEDDSLKFDKSLPAGQEGGKLRGEEKTLEEENFVFNNSEEVKEASPFAETTAEGNQVDIRGEEKEFPKSSFGEEEKLDGDKEALTDEKQDDESNVGRETAKVDEKPGVDREMEEAECSQLNADDGLCPESLQDGSMVEDGKTHALDTESMAVKESDIELKENTKEMEERQSEAKEDKEMDGEAEKEMEPDEREEAPKRGSGKRKGGRTSKSASKAPPRKVVGEDVCFICLDGGDLVLCDRRGCPKAYHPSCIDRDEAFFRSKGLWNCGWHLCRECKKNAYYMCYTCQCSLCKGCLEDDATFFCVRGSKGLCQTCMKSVMLIENNEGNGGMATFDDKSSMDYLFKDYWIEQKENLSLTSDEIALLINQWKRSNADHSQEMLTEARTGNTEGGAVSDTSLATAVTTKSERKKSNKRMRSSTTEVDYDADGSSGKAEATGTKKRGRRLMKSQSEEADPNVDSSSNDHLGNIPRRKNAKKLSQAHAFEVERTSSQSSTEWASKELLEFVAHVKNGDKSALSQFDVQELLLEYVKRNKLRDPRRTSQSQIVCDAMLQKLFGKPRVGHIEMLKLLESHFFVKEDSQGDDNQGSVLDAEVSQLGTDENTDSFMDVGKSRGRKARKRGGLQSNLDDYAAIDKHNINLIYLRRNLIEALMEDSERFHEKVVGSFVRIKIPGSSQKQDIYRLVQVIGTPKAPEPYKVGKRTADCMLEILNLNKREVISIDTISNQDFDEDECKRLRQSIKCGFLSRMTVGDVLDKAKDLHVVRVTEWLDTEMTRLDHLRDRASDFGHKKQLRECVEKLQLLNTPEERHRRLNEIPEVHADPNMDPSYVSEDDSESEKERDSDIQPREAPFSSWRERERFPLRKGGDSPSTDPWSSRPNLPSKKWEQRSLSGKGFSSSRSGDAVVAEEASSVRPWSPGGNKMSSQSTTLEKLKTPSDSFTGNQGQLAEMRTNISASAPSEAIRPPSSLVQNQVKISETEKVWHYKDPTEKIQGPFSVVQLRKWNKNGYFPSSLRIWRTAQSENDSILLTEALAGRFEKEPSQPVAKPIEAPSQQVHRGQVINTLKIDQNRGSGNTTDQLSPTMQRSQADPRFSSNDSSNRHTSSQSTIPASTGRVRVSRWSGSPTPVQLPTTPTGAKGKPPPLTPDTSHVTQSSSSPSYERNRSFDRSHLAHQSTREAVSLTRSREGERLGTVYTQNPSSQPTVAASDTAIATTNNSSQGSSNNTVQPATGQNPAASAHGWGSVGYALRPEMMNSNLNNMNAAMQTQGQQQGYSHWQNTPANTLPPPPPFPAQNPPAFPSQAQWMTQVPAVQPNMQQGGTAASGSQGGATTQLPGNAGWAQMQAYNNMGWVAPSGPSPVGQFSSQAGTTSGAAMVQASGPALGMQPRNVNPGPWNWQPPQGGSGMVAAGSQIPKGQMFCPFLMQGHCVKGASCDYRHN